MNRTGGCRNRTGQQLVMKMVEMSRVGEGGENAVLGSAWQRLESPNRLLKKHPRSPSTSSGRTAKRPNLDVLSSVRSEPGRTMNGLLTQWCRAWCSVQHPASAASLFGTPDSNVLSGSTALVRLHAFSGSQLAGVTSLQWSTSGSHAPRWGR